MVDSIKQDITNAFDYGNMIVKLILINIGVFVITALINAFIPSWYSQVLPYIALSGDVSIFIYRPWTLLTHMFLHSGLFHILWNMLTLYWFGNITGDLLGDKKILPIYLFGGIFGAFFYLVSYALLPSVGGLALGASAAVLSIVFAAVATAPDYNIRLLFFGNVRIKYIGLFILFMDLIGAGGVNNSGGHIAHLGGTFFGFIFVWLLRRGYDLSNVLSFEKNKKNSKLRVVHKSKTLTNNNLQLKKDSTSQVDKILEKIKVNGIESLTQEEKDILYHASKN